jgi:hypothetical protein
MEKLIAAKLIIQEKYVPQAQVIGPASFGISAWENL